MDLYVWPSNKGIDSFDSDCLVVITYLRLGRCPINLHARRNSSKTDFSSIPLLTHGSNKVTGVSKILEYLRKENYGLEYELADEELARLESLVVSLERRVTPACRWLMWADANVYRSYTSPIYRSYISYLSGLWYPRLWRNQMVESAEYSQLVLCSNTNAKKRHPDAEVTLYEGARRCLTALSYVLGDKEFFFGDKPTAIDAYVFGRLWPLLNYDRMCRREEAKIGHKLVSHIYQCENLFHLCRRVQRLCFPYAGNTMRSSAHDDTEADEKAGSGWFSSRFFTPPSMSTLVPSCLAPFRDTIVFGALVLTILGVFAVGSGLIGFGEEEDVEGGPGLDSLDEFVDVAEDD